jgi:hypothetical protein
VEVLLGECKSRQLLTVGHSSMERHPCSLLSNPQASFKPQSGRFDFRFPQIYHLLQARIQGRFRCGLDASRTTLGRAFACCKGRLAALRLAQALRLRNTANS